MPDSKRSMLPAFACVGESIDLWPVSDGLTYSQATAEGRDRAEQLIEGMRRTDCPAILGHVVEAMIDRGEHGGVEVGFCQSIAIALMQAQVTQFVEVARERFPISRSRGCMQLVG